jgi:hypothetical protein
MMAQPSLAADKERRDRTDRCQCGRIVPRTAGQTRNAILVELCGFPGQTGEVGIAGKVLSLALARL